jgi:hypothetical protein
MTNSLAYYATEIITVVKRFIVQGLYYKTLRSHNSQKVDRFRGKLVTFGFDKDTSLNKQTH